MEDISAKEYFQIQYQKNKDKIIERSKNFYQQHKDDPLFRKNKAEYMKQFREKLRLKKLKERNASRGEYTNRPSLFMSTYWGNCCYSKTDDEIIQNRNQFLKDYNIKGLKKETKKIESLFNQLENYKYLDHQECYRTKDKKNILIVSPYHRDSNKEPPNGWTKIYPLYSNSCYTFLKIV